MIARWMIVQYAKLWKAKKEEKFTLEEAAKVLGRQISVSAVILSNLRKAGWVEVNFDPSDHRRRFYILKKPETMINIIGSEKHATKNNENYSL